MTIDREEEITVLYALYRCGGKGSKGRIIAYILQNNLLMRREGDEIRRANNERAIENDLARSRQNLKKNGELEMPEHGVWRITEKGRERLFSTARKIAERNPEHGERVSRSLIEGLIGVATSLPPQGQ